MQASLTDFYVANSATVMTDASSVKSPAAVPIDTSDDDEDREVWYIYEN